MFRLGEGLFFLEGGYGRSLLFKLGYVLHLKFSLVLKILDVVVPYFRF